MLLAGGALTLLVVSQLSGKRDNAGPGILLTDTLDRSAERFFQRCADARAAGVAPIHRGQPGYRSELDRDGDGVACEPYR